MKSFTLAFLLVSTSIGMADSIKLEEAQINQEVLGGDILLIKMRDYLIISGKESQALDKELGEDAKKNFKRDMVTTKALTELVALYNPSKDRPTVQTILDRYSNVLFKVDSKSNLN